MQDIKEYPELAQKARDQLDQGDFYLGALRDAWREMSGLKDIHQILDTFLLVVMGVFGIRHGYILFKDRECPEGWVVGRGLKTEDMRIIREEIPKMASDCFQTPPHSGALPEVETCIIPEQRHANDPFCHPQTRLLVRWTMDKGASGFVGLGEKIRKEDYTHIEIAFLMRLTEHLMLHMSNARLAGIITSLRSDIRQKGDTLEESLAYRARIQKELDRRIFHQKILSDVVGEMSGLCDPKKIMEVFLLTLMGTFGVVEGYFLLLNRDDNAATLGHRGIGKEKIRRLSVQDTESLITRVFEAASDIDLSPMEVKIPANKELLYHPAIPFRADRAFLFTPDRSTIGLIGLGKAGSGEVTFWEDRDLLQMLFKNLMVFLSNAQSVTRIQKLNAELENKNIELRRAIDKLKAGSLRIELLEKAGSHIKSVIQKEAKRAKRLSAMDFLLILGIGVLMGLAYNHSNPSGISLIPQSWSHPASPLIDVDRAKIKYDAGTTLFVDARPPDFFQQRRIEGAVNLPLTLFDFVYMMKFGTIDPSKELIIYGRNISRLYDEDVASKLIARGHTNVRVLSGGLSAWAKKGHPIAP